MAGQCAADGCSQACEARSNNDDLLLLVGPPRGWKGGYHTWSLQASSRTSCCLMWMRGAMVGKIAVCDDRQSDRRAFMLV